ncbi:unnamed protein product [Pleuronectes platessa]|uniref:Uncharacterized protein n=1 Tax=Pleuronectes platessa TaxID=8262 RepID=A0A9N7U0D4_PLEPL|nr:unnamed protein product [Pleuronectes platessa]
MHRPIKISLIWPVIYLVFWAFLLIFSLYSEPLVCGIGLLIMLSGVPVYFLGVYWDKKPQCFHRLVDKMTYLGQKFCVVVYPAMSSSGEQRGERRGRRGNEGSPRSSVQGGRGQPQVSGLLDARKQAKNRRTRGRTHSHRDTRKHAVHPSL